ncbi:MAG: MBL fold metallo-hydrolase [Candidatus Blackburnbacteria bacterium]|nr:MBL fold metallo-hydrolase [Candidatus Blackburnbacteria bacterium]
MNKLWRYYFIFLALTVVLFAAGIVYTPDNNLHMVFCDVGQGDGILIYQKDKQAVVDGGPNDAILSCMSRYLPFWDRKVEVVILTNPDTDHYTGLVSILKNYKVENYVAPQLSKDDASFAALQQVVQTQEKKGMLVHYGYAGQKVELASKGSTFRGWEMEEVWPTREFFVEEVLAGTAKEGVGMTGSGEVLAASTGTETNELSLVYLLKFGNFKALLTGDLQPPATDELAALLSFLRPISVLKVPHHGSKNGLTENLLKAVSPQLAVISVGRNNRFGHPSPETLNLLKGVQTLRTDREGDIEVVTDGEKWWVKDF